jgi:endonuclease/exonuclease/phosphatase family metal-dependent hydrolase
MWRSVSRIGLAAAAGLLLLALAPPGVRGQSRPAGDADLLEVGAPPAARTPREAPPAGIRVVSYNIRYRSGEDLRALAQLLRDDPDIGGAAIVGLQEVDRNKRRTGGVNTARAVAEALGYYYAWAGQPRRGDDLDEEEDTGVALLSAYPIGEVERVVLPHIGPRGRRRVALGATVHVGTRPVRVYVVHAERRIPLERKVDQLEAVLDAVDRGPWPNRAIVLGDLNSHRSVEETVRLFSASGFVTSVPDDPTFRFMFLKTRLDWIWVRGLRPTAGGVTRRVELSDHWPIWAVVKL